MALPGNRFKVVEEAVARKKEAEEAADQSRVALKTKRADLAKWNLTAPASAGGYMVTWPPDMVIKRKYRKDHRRPWRMESAMGRQKTHGALNAIQMWVTLHYCKFDGVETDDCGVDLVRLHGEYARRTKNPHENMSFSVHRRLAEMMRGSRLVYEDSEGEETDTETEWSTVKLADDVKAALWDITQKTFSRDESDDDCDWFGNITQHEFFRIIKREWKPEKMVHSCMDGTKKRYDSGYEYSATFRVLITCIVDPEVLKPLLADGSKITVIPWEEAEAAGFPTVDILRDDWDRWGEDGDVDPEDPWDALLRDKTILPDILHRRDDNKDGVDFHDTRVTFFGRPTGGKTEENSDDKDGDGARPTKRVKTGSEGAGAGAGAGSE